MGLGAFVEYAHGGAVDHRQAAVAPAVAFVDEEAAGPGYAAVKAHTDGHIPAVLSVGGVGEKEDVAVKCVVGRLYLDNAGHTHRFHQLGV